MFKHYKALSLCAVAAMTGASVVATAPAFAQSKPFTVTAPRDSSMTMRQVSYRDLNLASIEDQRTLERRVGYAVKKVCYLDDYSADRSLETYSHFVGCSHAAWDGARPQIAAAVTRAQALARLGKATKSLAGATINVSARAGS